MLIILYHSNSFKLQKPKIIRKMLDVLSIKETGECLEQQRFGKILITLVSVHHKLPSHGMM